MKYGKILNGFENYQISNYGRVKSKPRERTKGGILKTQINKFGYEKVQLSKNNKPYLISVHRLVAEAFIPNPNNLPQVNHMDGNKQNNIFSNLEFCSRSENIKHTFRNLGRKQPTMKIIYSRNENGIKKYESKSEAISYLKSIGYEKSSHSRINVAIKTKGFAYGFKWSENVIDLIEVGDYVNGYKVRGTTHEKVVVDYYMYSEQLGQGQWLTFYKDNIESIVTHEQFNSIKYEVI